MHEKLDIDEGQSKISALEKNVSSSVNSILQSSLFKRQASSFLESSPICIKILDLDFNLQYISPAGIKSLNIDDITPFYNKPYPFSFYPQSFCDSMLYCLNKALKNNAPVEQEANIVDLQGNELWYHSTIIPVENEHGQHESIIVISIESTATNKAESELSKLRELQQNIGVQFQLEHSHQKASLSFMNRVTETVLANLHNSHFDVNALAEHLFMSRSTLQRKLTKENGVSVALFIREMRLSQAHQLIINNVHRTLAETAYAVGFKHPGNFAKLYKKYLSSIENR